LNNIGRGTLRRGKYAASCKGLQLLNEPMQFFQEGARRNDSPFRSRFSRHTARGSTCSISAARQRSNTALAEVAAIDRSQAVIEFNLDGTIVDANANFLAAIGYSLDEIRGKHHSMFVAAEERQSAGYRDFWARLNRGEYQAAQYKRYGKGGKEIWIQASYNPLRDGSGKVAGVIKFATDITAQKISNMEDSGKIAAISRAQAVIEFNMDGTIVTANENFLKGDGYSLDEIKGKHHSMFVTPEDRASASLCRILGAAEPRRVRGRLNTSGSAREPGKSGFWQPTTRSSTRPASRFKVVKSRPTSPRRS